LWSKRSPGFKPPDEPKPAAGPRRGLSDRLDSVTGLAKAAKVFGVPTILTTVTDKTFSGPLFPEVQAVFSQQQPIEGGH
jgi:hypothetical protein